MSRGGVGRRACTICAHPDRREMDELLAAGGSPTRLARRFRASKDALRRHAANHLGYLVELSLKGEYDGSIAGVRSVAISSRTGPGDVDK